MNGTTMRCSNNRWMMSEQEPSTIAELIEQSGKAQADIARHCDRSRSRVTEWKKSNRIPEGSQEKFAEAVGVDVDIVRDLSDPADTGPLAKEAARESWLRSVRHSDLDAVARIMTQSLLDFREPSSGLSIVTTEEMAEITNLEPDEIESRWLQVVNSPFVERAGKPKWVFRFVMPED